MVGEYIQRDDREKAFQQLKKIAKAVKTMTNMLEDAITIGNFETDPTPRDLKNIDLTVICKELIE